MDLKGLRVGKKCEINEKLLISTPRTPLAPQGGREVNFFIHLINIFFHFYLQGDHIWIEPVSKREFDVAIGARVVSAEGRKIQVNISNKYISTFYFHKLLQDRFNPSLLRDDFTFIYFIVRGTTSTRSKNLELRFFFLSNQSLRGLSSFLLTLVASNHL